MTNIKESEIQCLKSRLISAHRQVHVQRSALQDFRATNKKDLLRQESFIIEGLIEQSNHIVDLLNRCIVILNRIEDRGINEENQSN